MDNALQEKAFGYLNARSGNIVGFSVMNFEAITLGIQPFIDRINPEDPNHMTALASVIEEVKKRSKFYVSHQRGREELCRAI